MVYSATRNGVGIGRTRPTRSFLDQAVGVRRHRARWSWPSTASIDYRKYPRLDRARSTAARCLLLVLVVSPLGVDDQGRAGLVRAGPASSCSRPSSPSRADPGAGLAARGVEGRHRPPAARHGARRGRLLPMALIMLQPDLGTALVFIAITVGMLRGRRACGAATWPILALVGVRRRGRHPQLERAGDRTRRTGSPTFLDSERTTRRAHDLQRRTRARPPSPTAASPARACSRAPRPSSATCPSSRPTSSSPWWARSSASSGRATLLGLFAVIIWRIWRAAQLARDLLGHPDLRRRPGHVRVPGVRERGHDHGDHAGDRHPAAVHVLRRLVDPRHASWPSAWC